MKNQKVCELVGLRNLLIKLYFGQKEYLTLFNRNNLKRF